MPLNKEFEGREFDPITYEVTSQSIEEFADAIAPPTYLTKLNFIYGPQVLGDPELGLNYAFVVHGSQEYEFERPVRAGDTLVAKPKIGKIFAKGRNEFMVTEATIETTAGENVGIARSTVVSRGTAEA